MRSPCPSAVSLAKTNNRSPDSTAKAFTLIELTVVILIIAVLATLIMSVGSGMIDRGRKVQAKNDVTQIVTAVNAYYTEYGKYPMADAKQGSDTLYGDPNGSNGNDDVCDVLRATASSGSSVNIGDVLNPRKIIFLSANLAKSATSPLGGIASADATGKNGSPLKKGAFVDPWGNTYMIAIDGNYDGVTTDYLPYTSGVTYGTNNTIAGGCFVLSYGKDGKQGNNGDKKFTPSDDILSWQ